MTFQWTAVASFLYAEVAILFLLCIPGISPLRWQKIFMISLWNKIANYWNKAFLAIIILLIVLFLDAVREVRKYSNVHLIEKSPQGHGNPFDHFQMKLFRAQRNLYISGFSLFLWLVLRRTISLITQLASETSAHKALEIQVAETNEAARKLLQENEKLQESLKERKNSEDHRISDEINKELRQEIKELKTELEKSTNAFSKTTDEITVLKMEHERLEKEYDNLREEHKKLQEGEKHEKSL